MVLETQTNAMINIIANSDFGWLGNLVPLVLVAGFSWALSRKDIDFLLIQFPLMVSAKILFPFLHISFVYISFALFIANIVGSKGDSLAEIKSIPTTIKQSFSSAELKEATKRIQKKDFEEKVRNLMRTAK